MKQATTRKVVVAASIFVIGGVYIDRVAYPLAAPIVPQKQTTAASDGTGYVYYQPPPPLGAGE